MTNKTTIKPIRFITGYGPKQKVLLTFPTESRWTKQSFKDESDINVIMSQYLKTGILPPGADRPGMFLDTTALDFQDAMDTVANAHALFHALPSDIRARFRNNPVEYLAFCENPDNAPALVKMGLATLRPNPDTPLPLNTVKPLPEPTSKPQTPVEVPPTTPAPK